MAGEDDDDLVKESVERRREPRGVFPGLRVDLTAPKVASFDAVEASRRAFFIRVDDPEQYTLSDVHEATISIGGKSCRCRLEVFRKEIEPRRGVALRIAFIDPRNEELLKQILGPAAEV